ncbi:MAG: SDR family oxidoreductase [Bacteroidia bacterium]|nr:SDR family oxidoreductase [Bacteroidia bacterium]NNJ55375.1 SDR family oxidoreductase [Bacteroidia bacterium]
MDLAGKKVIITGVSSGIGKSLVEQYLEKGSIVCGLGRTDPTISNVNFTFLKTDIRNFNEVEHSISKFLKNHEGIDILINNAGMGSFGPVEDYSIDEIHEMFETNVYGTLYTIKLAVPIMKLKGRGHIINISSTAGIEGYPQVSVYGATKFAVKAISQSMYKELRDFGIKVTCVYPGSTKTDFFKNIDAIVPHDYMLMPKEVASMIVQATETSDNFHQVNIEVRPLRPKGPAK